MNEGDPDGRAGTLRQRLASLPGPGLPKRAWNDLLRLLRARRRRTGLPPQGLVGQEAIQRALDSVPGCDDARVHAVREGLRALTGAEGEEAESAAQRVEELVVEYLPVLRRDVVAVAVLGWPPSMTPRERSRVLGPFADSDLLSPRDAAQLRHELQGLDLGGQRLRVEVALAAGEQLPAVARGRRGGPHRRAQEGAWLPHLDAVGRWSASPRYLAQAHAQIFVDADVSVVLDPLCGCGADAVEFSRAGLRVLAREQDPGRAVFARRNLAALAPHGRHEVEVGDGLARLDAWMDRHPDAGLYLDPPWGSAEGGSVAARVGRTWQGLFVDRGPVESALRAAPVTVVKLPRDFDLASLPGDGWVFHWQFGLPEDGAGRVVKAISAVHRAAPRPP